MAELTAGESLLARASHVGFPPFTEEELPMTMQVGMVGTDGVVLASDTRWTSEPILMNTLNGARSSFDSSKILLSRNRGIAISCARNMETAHELAQKIVSDLKDEDLEFPIVPIEELGRQVLRGAGRKDAHCLIAFAGPKARLFQFHFSNVNGVLAPWCQEMQGAATVGDNTNNAIFWAQRYHTVRPIRELIPLAAHLVIAANKLNSGSISGLEIVVCDRSGVRFLPSQSIHELRSKADAWDREFGESIFRYGQQFSYD